MSKYNLPLYEPIEEIGETQQEIDLVNNECKNIYLGVWQGVMQLCTDVKQYQVENNLDTTFIDNEYRLVWDSIDEAFEDELITQEEVQILWDYKKEWYDLYAKQMGLPTEEEDIKALEALATTEDYKPLKVRYKYNKQTKENEQNG